ncbi:hypothetical protein BGZ52_007588, partial [Haplosporangium bisporale]
LDVDLEDFAIGYPPSKSHLPSCRERPVIEDLLPSTESSAAKRGTSWRDLFELADCYQAMRLREHCRVKIVSSQDKSNAADILFDFAYRHHDLKEQVLNFLSNPEDGLSAGDRDPFTAYKDHPRVDVPIEIVEQDGEYQFFIVLSISERIPATSGAIALDTLKYEIAIAIDDNKALETPLNVGPEIPEVREAALDYIAKNMKT